MAWYDTRHGNGEIFVRLLDADGRPAGPERRLTTSPGESYEASIEQLGDLLVVGWYDQTAKGEHTARLGAWTKDGVSRWQYDFEGGTRNPVIRVSAAGVFCAWIQTEAEGQEGVFARWWDADGRPTGERMRLGPASKTTWNLNAALDARGTPWVVFDTEATTRGSEVYVVKAEGATPTPIRLTKDDGAPSKYPDLAIGAGDRVALSWQDEKDGNVEVYLLTGRLGDLTGEVGSRAQRVTNTPGESSGAYLAWNGDRLGLAWSDKTSGQHEVYFESFDADGSSRGAASRITDTSPWSLVPAIRPWGDRFALAWTEYIPASDVHDGTAEVFFQLIP